MSIFRFSTHVDEILEKDLHALLPAEEEVAARQKHRQRVAANVMNPTLLDQLTHARVYPRETSSALINKID